MDYRLLCHSKSQHTEHHNWAHQILEKTEVDKLGEDRPTDEVMHEAVDYIEDKEGELAEELEDDYTNEKKSEEEKVQSLIRKAKKVQPAKEQGALGRPTKIILLILLIGLLVVLCCKKVITVQTAFGLAATAVPLLITIDKWL